MKHAITFVGDYSGVIMMCLLKDKSDTLMATDIFLADSGFFDVVKRLRTDKCTELHRATFNH